MEPALNILVKKSGQVVLENHNFYPVTLKANAVIGYVHPAEIVSQEDLAHVFCVYPYQDTESAQPT